MVMVIAKIVRGLFYLNLCFETVKMHKKNPRDAENNCYFCSFIILELYTLYKKIQSGLSTEMYMYMFMLWRDILTKSSLQKK